MRDGRWKLPTPPYVGRSRQRCGVDLNGAHVREHLAEGGLGIVNQSAASLVSAPAVRARCLGSVFPGEIIPLFRPYPVGLSLLVVLTSAIRNVAMPPRRRTQATPPEPSCARAKTGPAEP